MENLENKEVKTLTLDDITIAKKVGTREWFVMVNEGGGAWNITRNKRLDVNGNPVYRVSPPTGQPFKKWKGCRRYKDGRYYIYYNISVENIGQQPTNTPQILLDILDFYNE